MDFSSIVRYCNGEDPVVVNGGLYDCMDVLKGISVILKGCNVVMNASRYSNMYGESCRGIMLVLEETYRCLCKGMLIIVDGHYVNIS